MFRLEGGCFQLSPHPPCVSSRGIGIRRRLDHQENFRVLDNENKIN